MVRSPLSPSLFSSARCCKVPEVVCFPVQILSSHLPIFFHLLMCLLSPFCSAPPTKSQNSTRAAVQPLSLSDTSPCNRGRCLSPLEQQDWVMFRLGQLPFCLHLNTFSYNSRLIHALVTGQQNLCVVTHGNCAVSFDFTVKRLLTEVSKDGI